MCINVCIQIVLIYFSFKQTLYRETWCQNHHLHSKPLTIRFVIVQCSVLMNQNTLIKQSITFVWTKLIPYSGKCWREKTCDLLWIRQSFIRQSLVLSEKAIEAGLKFAKVFSRQNFPLYGIMYMIHAATNYHVVKKQNWGITIYISVVNVSIIIISCTLLIIIGGQQTMVFINGERSLEWVWQKACHMVEHISSIVPHIQHHCPRVRLQFSQDVEDSLGI